MGSIKTFLRFKRTNSRQNKWFLAAVLPFVLFGVSAVGYGLSSQQSIPTPPANQSNSKQSVGPTATPDMYLPYSLPVSIAIPAIGVTSDLITVGNNPDGTIEVPSGENYHKAAWYKHGSAPGQIGSAVIEGHVDSIDDGPSIFFNLGKLRPGDEVAVERQDGLTAIFTIDSVREFPKDEFPTQQVYGVHDYAALSLITCGGVFDPATGQYLSNIIVSAHLTDS